MVSSSIIDPAKIGRQKANVDRFLLMRVAQAQ
jgi:hypothetical protein